MEYRNANNNNWHTQIHFQIRYTRIIRKKKNVHIYYIINYISF